MAQDKRPINSDSRQGFAKEQSIGQNGEAQNVSGDDTQHIENVEHARNKATEGMRQGRDTDDMRDRAEGDVRAEQND